MKTQTKYLIKTILWSIPLLMSIIAIWKICFEVSEEDFKRGKKLPRDFNISEKLRKAYEKILKEGGV